MLYLVVRRVLLVALAALVTLGLVSGVAAADTVVPPGPTPANIVPMFGPGGDVSYGSSSAQALVASGSNLGDVDPVSGSLVAGSADTFVTDQVALMADLVATDQLNADALRAAERARLDADRRRRGKKLPSEVPYADLFEAAGGRYGVDPALLAAVAQAESGFAPDVISCARASSVGALGIMQFMPATAAGFGIDPCDPAQAIDAAAKFLKGLYDRFGDWDVALAAYNWGPNRAAVRDRSAWPPETRAYVAKINTSWQSYGAASTDGAQGDVGPEGCPTYAPPNTLRRGADSIGVYELCRRSVADAATPAAARAITTALSSDFLGKPYSQPRRNSPGWFDCSSFVTKAYDRSGTKIAGSYPPTTDTMTSGVSWGSPISFSSARPGDLVLSRAPGHVGMLLSDGFWVHTNQTGDVSHVTRAPSSAPLTLRVKA